MTTQTALDLLTAIAHDITALRAEVKYIMDIIETPPPTPAAPPALDGQPIAAFRDFTAESIIMTYNDKGEPAYKIAGYPYLKYGVRVWPEVLPALDINPASLKPGPNPYNRIVRALLVNTTDSATGEIKTRPQKIIGPGNQPTASQPPARQPAPAMAGAATPSAPANPPEPEEDIPF